MPVFPRRGARSSRHVNEAANDYDVRTDKSFRKQLTNIDNLIGQANLNLYGTDRTSDVDALNTKFQSILKDQIEGFTNKSSGDISSFLSQIVSNDKKEVAAEDILGNSFMSMAGNQYSTMQSFIYEAYRNRLLEQSDIHEVSSQLIELSEAILITRDAIVSADIVEGRMSRTIKINNVSDDDASDYYTTIENMEKKFKLQEKIKNFIIPKTLEYGEYYVYIIPYSKLFSDFQKAKEAEGFGGGRIYRESTLMESFDDELSKKSSKSVKMESWNHWIDDTYKKYTVQEDTIMESFKNDPSYEKPISKSEFQKDMRNIMNNISVCNDPVPIPFLEEGIDSFGAYKNFMEKEEVATEAKRSKRTNTFNRVASAKVSAEGITFTDDNNKKKQKKTGFEDIQDCYVKMLDPTSVVPIKIMNTTIGYFLVQTEDITPLAGAISSTLYYSKFNENTKQATIIDAIAERVVKSFDKDFLMKNLKFKQAIIDCITYYNINEKKLKFQYIPAEYIQEFKIDEDINGNGQSMLKKSLFYAKLYLMLLLFKIMSIILNSNDTKVNYIKQSGIDKNVANKVQEIARIRQSRQINITDLFSYTTLINKVGNGSEMYVPTGRSGERPIETEILSGQDIQLNSDLLEMLKNAYILGTGVPAAIVNYMNEADFAKVIEQNNTKFNGRVVNYQLDFNSYVTDMYKKIMRWSTDIDDDVIDNFEWSLQPPKTTSITTKSDLIAQFNNLCDFLTSLFYDDPSQQMDPVSINSIMLEIKEFKKLLVEDQLPMIDMEKMKDIVSRAAINVKKKSLTPDPSNGDNGDDDGLEEDLNNIQA